MTNSAQAWRCTVCGFVHRGPEPPGSCPVCGVPREEFEAYADPAAPAAKPAARRWFCDICGFIHEGPEPPEQCPVCGAERGAFEPREEAPPAAPPPVGDAPRRLVVVGAGVAGVAAVEAARRAAPDAEIVLLAREASLPYYRINLTRYLAGEVRREDLPLHPEGWYAEQRIDLRRGADVAGIDPAKRTVALRGGTEVPFDRLVLACGAHPFIPPLDGVRLAGVFALRTVEDADAILATARPGARVLCVGGGILGLETAGALARRKADVTVLESHASLMPRQLDPRGGARLAAHLATLGVRVRYDVRAKAVTGTDRATGLRIATGETLPADAIVLATGVRTESWLARQAGLTVKQGIVVDDRLQTSHPEIFAAGDAAEHQGLLYGNWFVAQAQGAVAGANAAGGDAAFGGVPRAHALKVLGLDTVSIGQFVPADGSYRAVADETEKAYRGFVFRDGVLVGANLVGDASLAGAVRGAIESRRDFSGILAKEPSAADVATHLAGKG